jgi:carbamoyl-phosphate synthase large subunit
MSGFERVVVTGGAGVIGRALVEDLAADGVAIRCIDVRPPPRWLPATVDYVQADLRFIDESVVRSFAPEVVYHLAATYGRSQETPKFWRENAEHNVRLSRRLLDAVSGSPSVRRLVFASSYLVYDARQYLSLSPPTTPVALGEDSAIGPRNACGAAKLLHEMELSLAEAEEGAGFTSVSARIFRVYGRGSRDVVARWARSALKREPIEIYGRESFFDYIFADDVAVGLRLLAEGPATGAVNLGTGHARQVIDVLAGIRSHVRELEVTEQQALPESWEASEADIFTLRTMLGWSPPTVLEDGIAQVVEHERLLHESHRMVLRTATPPNVGVLVTSASRKVPLLRAFREAFLALPAEGTLWAADSDELAAGALEADGFWHMPPFEALDPDDIESFCRSHRIRLVVPTRDAELRLFAELKPRLAEAAVLVAVGTAEGVACCDDKLAFSRFCGENGVTAVPTALRADEIDVAQFVVKERRGAGAASGAFGVSRPDALAIAATLDEPVFQPFLTGREYSIDVYIGIDGTPRGSVARTRDLVVAGESQVSTTVEAAELCATATRLATDLGIYGHAVFQGIEAEDGSFAMLECNPRVGGASVLAFAAGLKTPQYLIEDALGIAPTPPPRIHAGVRMVRAPDDRMLFT